MSVNAMARRRGRSGFRFDGRRWERIRFCCDGRQGSHFFQAEQRASRCSLDAEIESGRVVKVGQRCGRLFRTINLQFACRHLVRIQCLCALQPSLRLRHVILRPNAAEDQVCLETLGQLVQKGLSTFGRLLLEACSVQRLGQGDLQIQAGGIGAQEGAKFLNRLRVEALAGVEAP